MFTDPDRQFLVAAQILKIAQDFPFFGRADLATLFIVYVVGWRHNRRPNLEPRFW